MNELRATAALLLVSLATGAALFAARPRRPAPHPATPDVEMTGRYLGSGACRSCHPSQHDSWKRTYHSSMTREASALSWDGDASPKLPANLNLHGRDLRLILAVDEKGERISYRGPDLHSVGRALRKVASAADASPAWKKQKSEELFRTAPEVEREVVLTTGSHHYLAFWIEGGPDAELRQLPFVYLLDEERFLPRKDAFLQPPEALPHIARWNSNCIQCHTTGGRPAQSEGRDPESGEFWEKYETAVVENGISCESCHGPGQDHAAYYRSPLYRARDRKQKGAAHIFVPRQEEGPTASAACGQCHSYFVPQDPNQWWESGFSQSFTAGETLSNSRTILTSLSRDGATNGAALIDHDLSTIFWPDGSIIVGGREYNGLIESPCYQKAQEDDRLACTSCHSMHHADPDKQVNPKRQGNRMCTQCHEEVAEGHSRHEPDSPGALCTSCHMPRTSYALLHGIPNHQISSPEAAFPKQPHACSLCHVDRSASWIAENLKGFGVEDSETSFIPPHEELPLAVERALSGNAAERALYAYALGTSEAKTTANPNVAAALLPRLESDPYAAVRLIASRARNRLKHDSTRPTPRSPNSALPPLTESVLSELEEKRDNTPIIISE